jgi:signal transduction histidine kinase
VNGKATEADAKRRNTWLRMTAISIVNYALEAGVIAVYAVSGQVPAWLPVSFLVVACGLGGAFWLAIRTRWSDRYADPSLACPQFACSWAVQLGFLPLAPQIALVFLTCLMVGFNHALIVFRRQWFIAALVVVSLGMAMAIAAALAFDRADSGLEWLALWMLYALSMLRLTVIGTEFTSLRDKLSQRNRTLASSVKRLQALAHQERLAERERIARELHDELLQGVQGLVLGLQPLVEQLPEELAVRRQIERKVQQVGSLVNDSRDKVLLLRNADMQRPPLCEALAIAGEDLAGGRGAQFRMRELGCARALAGDVADEVYRIGREALLNAVQHSRCATIEVAVDFAEDALTMQVKDDGVGFEAAKVSPTVSPDASGISGMRDRATRLGGQLSLFTAPGEGTLLKLDVPAGVAYAAASAGSQQADWRLGP